MTERRAGQDGLGAQGGQERKGWHYWVDPWTGKGGWKRDADGWLRERNLSEEGDGAVGAYVSPFATLALIKPSRGKSTRPRIPPGE